METSSYYQTVNKPPRIGRTNLNYLTLHNFLVAWYFLPHLRNFSEMTRYYFSDHDSYLRTNFLGTIWFVWLFCVTYISMPAITNRRNTPAPIVQMRSHLFDCRSLLLCHWFNIYSCFFLLFSIIFYFNRWLVAMLC